MEQPWGANISVWVQLWVKYPGGTFWGTSYGVSMDTCILAQLHTYWEIQHNIFPKKILGTVRKLMSHRPYENLCPRLYVDCRCPFFFPKTCFFFYPFHGKFYPMAFSKFSKFKIFITFWKMTKFSTKISLSLFILTLDNPKYTLVMEILTKIKVKCWNDIFFWKYVLNLWTKIHFEVTFGKYSPFSSSEKWYPRPKKKHHFFLRPKNFSGPYWRFFLFFFLKKTSKKTCFLFFLFFLFFFAASYDPNGAGM